MGILGTSYSVNKRPNSCPHCHKIIHPIDRAIVLHKKSIVNYADIFYQCSNDKCQRGFIGYYVLQKQTLVLEGVGFGSPHKSEFSEQILKLSTSFNNIYNEAYFAEQHKLYEICGVGYRKALEFLIKDYAIFRHPKDKEKIKSKFLGKCIADYIEDTRIIAVAKRAAWLGNDETHYVKQWENQDLKDLKMLINLTVKWIEIDLMTQEYEMDMPD